ncbi:MAG: uracil-DNA glycosylase [Pseudomonadota bacterium]
MQSAREILEWYVEAGVDVMLEDVAINRFAESEASRQAGKRTKAFTEAKSEPKQARVPLETSAQSAHIPDAGSAETAREAANSAKDLEALRNIMSAFTGCNLKRTAKNTVFADGNPHSGVMFIGEAPGRDEDLQGLPFVGRAGQLLDRMLSAINLDREKAYITNVIPWRPPGNRTPTPQETEICRPFIERHIELVKPKVIILLGGSSAKTLLQTKDGIMRLRGKWSEVETPHSQTKAMPTLHPAYLLRQPAHKKLAWQDFLKVRQLLNELSG